MKIYSAVFAYKRPIILKASLESIFRNTVQPEQIDIIDDASGDEVHGMLVPMAATRANVNLITKSENRGATDSGRYALGVCRAISPQYFFPFEADYVFRKDAFETVLDVFENTEPGRLACGIVGYDAPHYYQLHYHHVIFPNGMFAQMGENNINWDSLHRPFRCKRHILEFVSNTHPTCYINWHRILEISSEFPELQYYLDRVYDPFDNPDYSPSGEYRKGRIIDDGMLSHAISLCWNRWAIKHRIDRINHGAWLNIKPSIAQNINGGGTHTGVSEMSTDVGSPTWQ